MNARLVHINSNWIEYETLRLTVQEPKIEWWISHHLIDKQMNYLMVSSSARVKDPCFQVVSYNELIEFRNDMNWKQDELKMLNVVRVLNCQLMVLPSPSFHRVQF